MSWATHELENYVIVKHLKTNISFLAVALGAFAPDIITKGFVYGFEVGPINIGGSDPIQFHRGWPGAGFTHSLIFGVVVSVIVLAVTRSRSWALGLLIGHWAHVITDINDTAGTMLFFPFSTENISTGMWKHAAITGRYGDAAAYYSSPGGIWDTFWLLMVLLFARHTLRREFFRSTIVPADPKVWTWLHRRFGIGERGLLALYRGLVFYGGCRIVAWTLFARFVYKAEWDPTWGGPDYIETVKASNDVLIFPDGLLWVFVAALVLAMLLVACWCLFIRKLWERGYDPPAVHRTLLPVAVRAVSSARR